MTNQKLRRLNQTVWQACVMLLAAGAAVGLGSGCGREQTTRAATPGPSVPVDVKTVRATRGPITRYTVLPANVQPNQQVTLHAKVAGYLERIAVDRGDTVKAGEVIAEIQAPELAADLARLKADLEIARIESERAGKAVEKAPDLITAQSVDATRAKYLVAKANLERAEALLSFCRITAPFSGTITRRQVDPGAFIPAAVSGSPANAGIVTLVDYSVVRVQAAVPEPEVPLIRKGLPVQVVIEELPNRVFPGSITRYAPQLDEARTMLVEVDLSNPKGELLPGMFANMRIGVETRTDTLRLPNDAVVMEKVNAFAFVVNDGKTRKVPLKTGFRDGTLVEVLSGVTETDAVVLAGKRTFTDGQAVNVTEVQ